MFLSKFDYYILSISLPTITRHFDVTPNVISIVVLVYFLVLTSTLLIWGKLGDKIGLKKLLFIGLIVFSISSFFSGLANNINILTFLRFFQGIGASILLVTSQAMISYYIPKKEQTRAFAHLTMSIALGMTMGTILGGYISELMPWNWIFWINIPVCLFVVYLLYIDKSTHNSKENQKHANNVKFDYCGALLIFLCQASFVFALYMGHKLNWNYIIISSLISSLLFLTLFIIRELKCSYPLLQLRLLNNIPFLLTLLAGGIAFFLVGGNLFLLPFYLITTKSLSSGNAGLILMTYPLFFLIMTFFISKILKSYSCWAVSITGMSITLISLIVFILTIPQSGIMFVILYLALLGIGLGLFFAPNTKSAMDFVSTENAGLAAGIYRTFNYVGLVLGICFFESIYSNFTGYTELPSKAMQLTGFQYAYTFGALIIFIGIICSIYAKKQDYRIRHNKQLIIQMLSTGSFKKVYTTLNTHISKLDTRKFSIIIKNLFIKVK